MPLQFFVNGIEAPVLEQLDDPAMKPIAQRFGLSHEPARYTFRCAIPMNQLEQTEDLRIEFRPGSGRELAPYQDWYVRLAPGLQADVRRRVRVAATPDAIFFESMGISDCRALSRALREYFDRDYNDCSAILDW